MNLLDGLVSKGTRPVTALSGVESGSEIGVAL